MSFQSDFIRHATRPTTLAPVVFLTILIAVVAIAVPTSGEGLLAAMAIGVLTLQAVLSCLQLSPLTFAGQSESITGAKSSQVFSVHVATYNEPPELVIQTIRALLGQDYSDYEIIVVDNNTEDADLWRPVANFCSEFEKVRFEHRMGVKGAKAGALEIARSMARPDTTHIVTVDADYRVAPDFLSAAATALDETGADFVQFPQAYLSSRAAPGLAAELADYFHRFASVGGEAGQALLTGTLSVISLSALDAVGGWRADTVTEDAELGVRLVTAGYRGVFVDQVAGKGLLPLSASSLCTQRRRWAHGNAATLLLHPIVANSIVPLRQLSAWLNILLPSALLLVLLLVLAGAGGDVPEIALEASALAVILCLLSAVLPFARRQARAGVCRIALLPSGSIATLEAVMGYRLEFRKTDKTFSGQQPVPTEIIATFALGALASGLSLAAGSIIATLASLGLLLPAVAYLYLQHELNNYSHLISEAAP